MAMKSSSSATTDPCCNTCANSSLLDTRVSVISVLCRICYDNDKDENLIAPCHCKGTVAFVHRTCLERWLAESNTTTCELCHVVFRTERSPKYNSRQSIWRWLHSQRTPGGIGRGVRSDIIACTVITPVAIVITYVCLFSSDYYNQKKFILVPAARWTSVSLLIMIGIMLIGYYLWVYSVIRLHSRMWYNWWQRECTVRYIPPSTSHIGCLNPNINITANPNNTPNTPTSASSVNNDNVNDNENDRQDAETEIDESSEDGVNEVDEVKSSSDVTITIQENEESDETDKDDKNKETTV